MELEYVCRSIMFGPLITNIISLMSLLSRLLSSLLSTSCSAADTESHFDGMVSTSNHLLPGEDLVYVKTSKPIWWTMELRPSLLS